jgi:transposase
VRYEEVKRLAVQGMSLIGISQALKMSQMTVHRYVKSEGFPERVRRASSGGHLAHYLPHIHQRFAAGCGNALQLWREVAAQGYTGKPAMVVRYVGRLRVRTRTLSESDRQKQLRLKENFTTPSAKRAARWLLMEEADLGDEERAFVVELRRASAEVERICEIGRGFQRIVKEKDEKAFAEWSMCAQQSGIKEMAGFAEGLKKDCDAVVEALRSEWSNGQTEGQVNRLKYLKRQMYGRAKFDLLKARVLHACGLG